MKPENIIPILLSFLLWVPATLAQQLQGSFINVPETVSREWATQLSSYKGQNKSPAMPAPDDLNGWNELQRKYEESNIHQSELIFRKLKPDTVSRIIGGVPVIDIKPKNWHNKSRIVLFLHAGAYTFLSARSSLNRSVLVATASGLRVISVDYTLAPKAKWQTVTDQVISVLSGLIHEGNSLKSIAIVGESAGGGLAAASVLKMRDKGLGMPAALVLLSPWVDLTENGDTYNTLKLADPLLRYDGQLKSSANAYADPVDHKNPYVSPAYGDFTNGFPPTLIQGGTKEILLSNFIRLYQALDNAGQVVKLDIYEGMPHNFQFRLPESPESQTALRKVDAFLKKHLGIQNPDVRRPKIN